MVPTQHNIKTSRTARYFVLGNSDLPVKELVFVLHGYGMNAGEFIRNFECLVEPGRKIIAPEGLSRFYRKGFSGEVVASWMTREDRIHEIEDYIGFLDSVYTEHINSKNESKVIVLGFSQGTSTASRWTMMGKCNANILILWSGEYANDIPPVVKMKPLVWNIIGTKDEFIPPERFYNQTKYLVSKGFDVKEEMFHDKHIIHRETLIKVWKEIQRL